MSDLPQMSTSELIRLRDELANRHPVGHTKARRIAERIAVIDAALADREPDQTEAD